MTSNPKPRAAVVTQMMWEVAIDTPATPRVYVHYTDSTAGVFAALQAATFQAGCPEALAWPDVDCLARDLALAQDMALNWVHMGERDAVDVEGQRREIRQWIARLPEEERAGLQPARVVEEAGEGGDERARLEIHRRADVDAVYVGANVVHTLPHPHFPYVVIRRQVVHIRRAE